MKLWSLPETDPATALPEPLNAILERLTVTSAAIIRKRTVSLPNEILVQAVIMLCSYLYDSPLGTHANAWIRSGCMDICRPWLRRRAGIIERK